jgi:hypothetical protein
MIYSRKMLMGSWYLNSINEQNNHTCEYAKLSIDGSFEFSFVTHNSHGEILEEIIELGDWGLVGDIHFTMTKSEFIDGEHYAADLANEDNYQAYRVLRLTNQIFEYQHLLTKEVYILKRVVDKIGHC